MATTAAITDAAPDRSAAGWLGSLELGFRAGSGRTIMERRRHTGPFVVQSAFYPEGAPCHAYLLHPPGGLVGGDRLHLDLECASGAHALVTTPAAGKIYRSTGAETRVRQHLRVAAGATLEFLPAESIVFDGARCVANTHLDLRRGATLLAWDAWVLGRPANGDTFDTGRLRQSLELSVDDRPVLIERNDIHGGGSWMKAAWGLRGRPACATLLAFPAAEHALDEARRETQVHGCDAAVTVVDEVLVARVIASSLMALRGQMERWWRALRPTLTPCAATPPRIWAT